MEDAERPRRLGRGPVRRQVAAVLLVLLIGGPILALVAPTAGTGRPTVGPGVSAPGTGRMIAASTVGPTVLLSLDHPYGYAPLQTNITVTASGGSTPYNLTFCPSATNCERDIAWMGNPWPIREQFSAPGNYSVNATVIDASGEVGIATALIQVLAVQPLTAGVSEAGAQGEAPFHDAFDVLLGGGVAPYTVTWTFGDGTSLAGTPGIPVNHTYDAAGSYTPQVTVRDSRGSILTRSLPTVTVVSASTQSPPVGLLGASSTYLALIAATATVAIGATGGVGYAWYARRLQREANELVSQLWEEDALAPGDRP